MPENTRKRLPILTMREFELQHAERELQLRRFMTTKRGRFAISDVTAESLKDSAALSLKANATHSRILFARAFAKQIEKKLIQIPGISFLTVTPAEFAIPVEEARRFKIEKLKDWAANLLRHFHHISVVEPAYYSNWRSQPGAVQGLYHWHFHSLIWPMMEGDTCNDIIADLMSDPERRPLIPGFAEIKLRQLIPEEYVGRGLYMVKAPLSEYRVYPKKRTVTDRHTGQKQEIATGKYKQRKRALRPGAASRLCDLMVDQTLYDLTFAKGDGKKILDKSLKNATAKAREIDDAEMWADMNLKYQPKTQRL